MSRHEKAWVDWKRRDSGLLVKCFKTAVGKTEQGTGEGKERKGKEMSAGVTGYMSRERTDVCVCIAKWHCIRKRLWAFAWKDCGGV
jgi:hypothetical protein